MAQDSAPPIPIMHRNAPRRAVNLAVSSSVLDRIEQSGGYEMKTTIGLFLVGLALSACQNAEKVQMDTTRAMPSSSGKCQEFIAGRMVDVACPQK